MIKKMQRTREWIVIAVTIVALVACAVIYGAVSAQAAETPTTKVGYLTYTLDTANKTASLTDCDISEGSGFPAIQSD